MSGSIEKRFYRKSSKERTNKGCIEWLGWKNNRGYGLIKSSDKPYRHLLAHRVAYELHYGSIPQGMDVMHSCDNRSCVNWEHLSIGTRKDNMADMLMKNRQRHSQLDEDDFNFIRLLRSQGLTQQEIARNLNVSRPLISMILSGKISPQPI